MSKRGVFSQGQALVEYALILVLGAVVVIVIAIFMGHGIQRIFGIVAGSLGATYGSDQLRIQYAECAVLTGEQKTGLYVRGDTHIPWDQLTGSTDKSVGGSIGENLGDYGSHGQYSFQYTTTYLDNKADPGACPKAVVIQSTGGAITVAPVKVNVK